MLPGSVCPLEPDLAAAGFSYKVPHIGWNSLHLVRPENPLMANTREGDFVYFVHSFYVKGCGDALVAGAEYGVTVPGAVARGNVYGCQFHPEKSGEAGLRILRAFAALCTGIDRNRPAGGVRAAGAQKGRSGHADIPGD